MNNQSNKTVNNKLPNNRQKNKSPNNQSNNNIPDGEISGSFIKPFSSLGRGCIIS